MSMTRMEALERVAHVRLSSTGYAYIVSGMGSVDGKWREPVCGSSFAVLTARVPLPSIRTIPATVLPLAQERGE